MLSMNRNFGGTMPVNRIEYIFTEEKHVVGGNCNAN